jgi:diaminopimelate decarboxylase
MYNLQPKLTINIADIVNKFSTPLIIYTVNELNNKIVELLAALPVESRLLYSVKANPNPFILNLFNQAGLGFEVASVGELQHVIKSKIHSDRIVLGGPIKSKEAILLGIQNHILSYNVESEQDLQNIASASNQRLNISLRINPDFSNRNSVLKMGGVSSQFGIDENNIIPLIRKYKNEVNINGLFIYAGSQFFDAQNIIQNTSFLIEFAEKHKDEFNQIDFLDFGGGFGIAESADQSGLNMNILKTGLADLFKSKKQFLDKVKYKFFESGRYLTATSAILLSTVLDIKYSKGKKYIILDTGINHLGLRQLLYRTHGRFISTLKEYEHYSPAILTGATCTPLDIIQNEVDFPNVAVDDLVLIHNVGAYTATLSPYNFCGFNYPAEVTVDTNGYVVLIRERGGTENSCGIGYKY